MVQRSEKARLASQSNIQKAREARANSKKIQMDLRAKYGISSSDDESSASDPEEESVIVKSVRKKVGADMSPEVSHALDIKNMRSEIDEIKRIVSKPRKPRVVVAKPVPIHVPVGSSQSSVETPETRESVAKHEPLALATPFAEQCRRLSPDSLALANEVRCNEVPVSLPPSPVIRCEAKSKTTRLQAETPEDSIARLLTKLKVNL